MKKRFFLVSLLAASVAMNSCSKEESSSVKPINFDTTTNKNIDTSTVNPTPTPTPEPVNPSLVIDENSTLKSFVDRVKYPNYKLSGALDVGEFHNNTNGVRDIVAANFDESPL